MSTSVHTSLSLGGGDNEADKKERNIGEVSRTSLSLSLPPPPSFCLQAEGSVSSNATSIWDQYRHCPGGASGDVVSSLDTTRCEDDPPSIVVPAGVDPGKFLEAQLKRVSNRGIVGPKKVRKKNHTCASVCVCVCVLSTSELSHPSPKKNLSS